MNINPLYLTESFQRNFLQSFLEGKGFIDNDTGAILRCHPFQVTTLPNFIIEEDNIDFVRGEIQDSLSASSGLMAHRKNDLHDFYQSGDLGRNYDIWFRECSPFVALKRSVDLFVKNPFKVKTLLETITGCHLASDRIDIAAQVYTPGSYLLCHDDALEGRLIAWVLYLIEPGSDAILGGSLELFGCEQSPDRNIYPTCVVDEIRPSRNMLMFFPVSQASFHAVAEVIKGVRVSIAGWFYAQDLENHPYALPSNTKISISKVIPDRVTYSDISASLAVNEFYQSPSVLESISKVFRKEYVISLTSFFSFDSMKLLVSVHNQIPHEKWKLVGPPNHRRFYENDFESNVLAFFAKNLFFDVLFPLMNPTFKSSLKLARIHKFTPGSYMVIHDDFPTGNDKAIDVLFFIPSSSQSFGTVQPQCNMTKESRVHYTCLRKKKKGVREEEVLEIDPFSTNTLYMISVQKDTQISVDYLTCTSGAFEMFFLRFGFEI